MRRKNSKRRVKKLLRSCLVKDVAGASGTPDEAGTISGTPQYMAPEQIVGAPGLNHRCDLYALGAVACFLLTGRPPFEGNGAVWVMMAHAHDPVVPPSRHCPGVPEDLERVVLHCLAKDPADRYPDTESMQAALVSCAAAGEWDTRQAARWWQEVVAREANPIISTSYIVSKS